MLWLQNFNLRIKCFKVTPYKYGNQIMVEFDQIIPVEDTEEFQIKIVVELSRRCMRYRQPRTHDTQHIQPYEEHGVSFDGQPERSEYLTNDLQYLHD